MDVVRMQGMVAAPLPAATTIDKLEQAFLEEMLIYCGPSAQKGEFGGGAGEDQFQSFLTRQHAEMLAARIDLGLRLSQSEGAA